jgi:hypothetical protein
MGANQNFILELGLHPDIDLMPLSSNSVKTTYLWTSYQPSKPGQELRWKHETILARTRARLVTKIKPKISSCHHRHFTEHLVGVFRKQPFESN